MPNEANKQGGEFAISADSAEDKPFLPPRQHNYEDAAELAIEIVRKQPEEQLEWLGAKKVGNIWRLGVFNGFIDVDFQTRTVSVAGEKAVGRDWRVLVLHYLKISERPICGPPEIVFASLPSGRVYASVYQNRVIGRLCHTVGREIEKLRLAAESLGGKACEGGDASFDFAVFPRIGIRLIWHGPDEEFPSSSTILLPRNIESFFSIEDVVVISECFVARMSGKPF